MTNPNTPKNTRNQQSQKRPPATRNNTTSQPPAQDPIEKIGVVDKSAPIGTATATISEQNIADSVADTVAAPPSLSEAIKTEKTKIASAEKEIEARREVTNEAKKNDHPIFGVIDQTVQSFVDQMFIGSSVSNVKGGQAQLSMYRMFKMVLSEEGVVAQQAFTYLLWLMNESRANVFVEDNALRFLSDMRGTADDRDLYRCLMSLFLGLMSPSMAVLTISRTDVNQISLIAGRAKSVDHERLTLNLRTFMSRTSRAKRQQNDA